MINFQTSFGFVKKVFVDPVILLRFAMVFLDLILKLISPKHSDLKFICRILLGFFFGLKKIWGFPLPAFVFLKCIQAYRLPMTNSPRAAVVGFRIPQMHSGISSSRSRIPRAAVVAFLQSQHHF